MPLHLEIVTPERMAYSDDVDMVLVPGVEGELGILPHHTPLVSLLGVGELKIRKGGTEESFAIEPATSFSTRDRLLNALSAEVFVLIRMLLFLPGTVRGASVLRCYWRGDFPRWDAVSACGAESLNRAIRDVSDVIPRSETTRTWRPGRVATLPGRQAPRIRSR